MPTPPCSALKPDGSPCLKAVGTVPTPEGPRCWSHLARDKRRTDPKSKIPIKTFRTSEDVNKVAAWVMARAAENHLSAPSANAVTAAAKVWLKNHEAQTGKLIDRMLEAAEAVMEMNAAHSIPPERRTAHAAAYGRFIEALDQLRELAPSRRDSPENATARRERREAQEPRAAIAPLDPDDASLDDATPEAETEDL